MTGDAILGVMCVAFALLPASVIAYRTGSDPEQQSDEHDPATCGDCARLRHPSQAATRAALRSIPAQRQGGRS